MGRLRSLLLRSRTARCFTPIAGHLPDRLRTSRVGLLLWSGSGGRSLMLLFGPRGARGRARCHTVLRFGAPVTCRSLSCRGLSLICGGLSCLGRTNRGGSLLSGRSCGRLVGIVVCTGCTGNQQAERRRQFPFVFHL